MCRNSSTSVWRVWTWDWSELGVSIPVRIYHKFTCWTHLYVDPLLRLWYRVMTSADSTCAIGLSQRCSPVSWIVYSRKFSTDPLMTGLTGWVLILVWDSFWEICLTFMDVNLEQIMDVTNDEDVRTLVESAREDTLSEHRRRDSVVNCESSASTYRTYERLEVSVRKLLSRVNDVVSRSRATLPFVEDSFEREAALFVSS